VIYALGSHLQREADDFAGAVEAARSASVAVVVLGLSQEIEGEEGETSGVADRTDLGLPDAQDRLLRAVHATGTPVVLVLLNGSALAVNWAAEHVPAIVEAWYPGEAGGTAIADVLFGDVNPAGRLPVTFYRSVDQLSPFEDYSMAGRTYRYFDQEPLYPFGYGLSYTEFRYRDLEVLQSGRGLDVRITVENVGAVAGDEVVQVYLRALDAKYPGPRRHLEGFRRLHLRPGESRSVAFRLTFDQFAVVDEQGERRVQPGGFEVAVGGGQPAYAPHAAVRLGLVSTYSGLVLGEVTSG
jgi:beta-glucosidase